MAGIDWFAVAGCATALLLAFWYADRRRHLRRGALNAFLIFAAAFGGPVLAGLLAAVGAVRLLGARGTPEEDAVTAVVPVFFFLVVAPAFLLARWLIQRPPAKHDQPGR